ncbi:DNA helicase, partial [Roseomonas mucosa]|nr:DNA helicase [Roseomonas mucosa]
GRGPRQGGERGERSGGGASRTVPATTPEGEAPAAAEGEAGQAGTPAETPRPREERPRDGNRQGRQSHRDERHGKGGPSAGGQGNKERGDRPRGDRPFSDRDRKGGDREPRVFQIGGKRDSGPDPDSPFAALAKLKLGK